jgi:hypothetical protein
MVEYCRNPGHAGDSPYQISDLTGILRPRGYREFVFVKRHDEFEVIQLGMARSRPGDWGNLVFIHYRVRERLLPILHDAANTAHDRLLDRALWFREECAKREQVIAGLTRPSAKPSES